MIGTLGPAVLARPFGVPGPGRPLTSRRSPPPEGCGAARPAADRRAAHRRHDPPRDDRSRDRATPVTAMPVVVAPRQPVTVMVDAGRSHGGGCSNPQSIPAVPDGSSGCRNSRCHRSIRLRRPAAFVIRISFFVATASRRSRPLDAAAGTAGSRPARRRATVGRREATPARRLAHVRESLGVVV